MTAHNCYNDPEGCTDACDARALARYERSREGRAERQAMVRVGIRRHCTTNDLRRCTCDFCAHSREVEAERERILSGSVTR